MNTGTNIELKRKENRLPIFLLEFSFSRGYMNPAEIAATLGASINIARTTLKAIVKAGASAEIADALEKVEVVYSQLFDLNTKLLAIQSENEVLKKEIEKRDDWERRKAEYKLFTTPAGSIIWEFQGEPKHYACPVCMESKKEIHILQDKGRRCKNCTNFFSFNPPEPDSSSPSRRNWVTGNSPI